MTFCLLVECSNHRAMRGLRQARKYTRFMYDMHTAKQGLLAVNKLKFIILTLDI